MLFDAETKDMAIWEYADRKSEEGARVEMSDGPSNQHKEWRHNVGYRDAPHLKFWKNPRRCWDQFAKEETRGDREGDGKDCATGAALSFFCFDCVIIDDLQCVIMKKIC